MAYEAYANESYYFSVYQGDTLGYDDAHKWLLQASRHIDALTFNRIVAKGFDNLTEFQKDVIKEVVYRQAEFEYENEDMINTVLSSYSLNGVSMNFGSSWNLYIEDGVAIRKDLYALLEQTGLCCRLVGV